MTSEQAKRQADRVSGVSNVAYDLVTILENKLKGVAAMEEYKQDATRAGDDAVRQLLEELERREAEDIAQIKPLLMERLR